MRRETRGRPPEGEHGQRVADYPRLAVRVPVQTKARAEALADDKNEPLWKTVAGCIEATFERDLAAMTPGDRAHVMKQAKRYAERLRRKAGDEP